MNRAAKNPFFWLMLIILTIIFLMPIVYMALTAFKTRVESQSVPPSFLPREWTSESFTTLLNDPGSPVLQWLLNSFLVAAIGSVLSVTICSMAGYAFARLHFRGRDTLFAIIVSLMFVPGFVFLMPNFEMMNRLEWLDSYKALILPGAAGAFGMFLMRQFFLGLPKELEESARIDGAGPFTTFFRVILPNARAGLMTLLVLSFLGYWNDFIWPLYTMFSEDRLTLAVGLARLQGSYTIDYPVIMAGATIAAIPVLIIFIFLQRYIIQGVAASGVKG